MTTHTYDTEFCSVVVLYTLHEERPTEILRDGRGSAVCAFSDSPGDVMIVDYYVFGDSWFDCSFFPASLRVITLTARPTAGVFLYCVHGYRAFCRTQAVLQTAAI